MCKFCDSVTPCFGSGMDAGATVFFPRNKGVYLRFAEVDTLTALALIQLCVENFRGHFIHGFVQLALKN